MERKLVNYEQPKTIFDLFFNDFKPSVFNDFRSNTEIKTNLIETENDYLLDVIVPGFNKEDIKIDIDNNTLIIYSEVKNENIDKNDNYIRKEYSYASFEKRFTLPKNTDVDNIQAKHENGILKLTIPKNEKVVSKKQITIK
jgi:HSP20 family protein